MRGNFLKPAVLVFAGLVLHVRADDAQNPIIHADAPDMAMIRVGDTYYNVSTTFEVMDQALTEMETLGLPIHITELDVNSAQGGQRGFGADISNNAATTQGGLVDDADRKLAEAYEGLFRAFVKHRNSVEIVTFWGANDANSWRSRGRPLLFDSNAEPKPAFDAVIRAASGRQSKSTQ